MSTVPYALPDVGEGLHEAEILSWHVAPGDSVREDDVLVEIETDKSVVEIPSPHAGTVVGLGGQEGDVIAVGELLVEFDVADDSSLDAGAASTDDEPGPDPDGAGDASTPADPVSAGPPATARPSGTTDPRVLASPSTRRRAVALGVTLTDVEGTGPDGRVTQDDVERAAAAPGEQAAPERDRAPASPSRPAGTGDRVQPLSAVRRRIAEAMSATLEIPAIPEWRDVDATDLLAAHRRLRDHLAAAGVRLTLLSLVVKATAAALREHPRFNATFDASRGEVTYHGRVDIGIATATSDGLLVPVLRGADGRSLRAVAGEIDRLAAGARERTLPPAETRDGTCTISNFGSFGTTRGAPLIRPPEVAIVGIGRVHDAVVAVDGQPVVRPVLPLVVSTDHRVNDGDHLAAFCDTLEELLAHPTLLLAD